MIGEGQVDFSAIFKTLAQIDYAAPLVIEMWAQDEHWLRISGGAKARLVDLANQSGFNLV